ncbi:MAG: metal-dependent hydrolase [Thermotogae bacterium]|nr:metal-dependent hydrolase [Thermotogota bacterium]
MEIIFLGTAAFEGYPNPFCDGDHCIHALKSDKVNKRLRSAVLVDDKILIDFGPDIVASCQKLSLSLSKVELLLITHSHEDHLYIPNFAMRQKIYNGNFDGLKYMKVMASSEVINLITESEYVIDAKVSLDPVKPFNTYAFSEYEIIPVPANHYVKEKERGLLYLIKKGDKVIFYATDTGPFNEDYVRLLKENVNLKKLDLLVLDATLGFSKSDYLGHNTYEGFIQTLFNLKKYCLLDASSLTIAHHFSHHSNPDFNELGKLYQEKGILVSYDGMKVSI